jgi:hypothetical protein
VEGFIEALPGNAVFADKLTSIVARAATLEIPFEEIVKDFHEMELRRFGDEGPGWDELLTSTLDRKEYAGYGDMPTLVRTTDLVDSLGHGTGFGFTEMTPFSVTMGTTAPYAGYQQYGTSRMVARPIVKVDETTAIAWGLIIKEYLYGGTL